MAFGGGTPHDEVGTRPFLPELTVRHSPTFGVALLNDFRREVGVVCVIYEVNLESLLQTLKALYCLQPVVWELDVFFSIWEGHIVVHMFSMRNPS